MHSSGKVPHIPSDIEKVLVRFLGKERTTRALKIFQVKYNVDKNDKLAEFKVN